MYEAYIRLIYTCKPRIRLIQALNKAYISDVDAVYDCKTPCSEAPAFVGGHLLAEVFVQFSDVLGDFGHNYTSKAAPKSI